MCGLFVCSRVRGSRAATSESEKSRLLQLIETCLCRMIDLTTHALVISSFGWSRLQINEYGMVGV